MYKKCILESSTLRQKEIAAEFLNILQKHPLSDITISDLTKKIDIPRKTFYRYFDCKEDVVLYLLDEAALEFKVVQNNNSELENQNKFKAFYDFWYTKRDLLKALKYSNLDNMLSSHSTIRLVNNYMGESNLTFHPNTESYKFAMIFAVSGLFALLLDWRDKGFTRTSQEMASMTEELLFHPLFKVKENI